MKKLLLTLFTLTGLAVSAQIAPGSVAPDFTVTDINGNTHTLSNYIAQGKTVILDISATWCGPCWNYHESGVLEQLYYTYGPEGSDDLVVLFIEGDNGTSVESLYGTNMPGDNGVTAGDWTKHSPYPIIDSWEVGQLYQITYFPTIFRICPDGKVSEVLQLQFPAFRENINTNCQVLTDLQQHSKTVIDDLVVCEGGTAVPKVSLTNYGFQTITSATIELRNGSEVLATKNYTGSLAMFYDDDITFDPITIDPADNYEAVVTTINGAVPGNVQTATATFNVTETLESGNNITVRVHTNFYPGEISWAIKNSAGTVVASGGPYEFGNEDFFGGGGADANTTKVHQLTLPGSDLECHSVEFYSANGLGWIVGETPHGIEIESGGEVVFSKFVGNFGSVLAVPAAFKTTGMLGTPQQEAAAFAMYPNPTAGVLHITTNEPASITLYDLTGKKVFTADDVTDGAVINLASLQKGMYIAQVKTNTLQKTEKLIVN